MKKIISVLLVMAIMLSISILPASAVSKNSFVPDTKVASILKDYFRVFTGVSENAEITVDSALLNEISENRSVDSLSESLSTYAFVKADDIEDETVAKLIEETDTTIIVQEDDTVELFIAVDLAKHPEIFKLPVFKKYVVNVIDNTAQYYAQHGYDPAETDKNLVFDSYERFAGELALHMVLYKLFSPIQKIFSIDFVNTIVNKSVYAEINPSENRAPAWFMKLIGNILLLGVKR
ncbi:MAG: hypothetical protein MJ147_08405 [Clostridia bacterium]|nr:hypothetical protein [Clostridia bacterium]